MADILQGIIVAVSWSPEMSEFSGVKVVDVDGVTPFATKSLVTALDSALAETTSFPRDESKMSPKLVDRTELSLVEASGIEAYVTVRGS